MESHPLEAMMQAAAIAAKAAEIGPPFPVVATGTPADDAFAALATQMNSRSAEMVAEIARGAKTVEDIILDGVPSESSDHKKES
jgi:hypothetical protein